MKTLAKGILTTLILTLTIGFVFGQKGVEDGSRFGHGEDSIRCIKNLSLYREYARQKNYDLALDGWTLVYTECPKASKYIYIDGIKMIEGAIKKEKDAVKKETLVDSMMNIYDKRIKYFGEKGRVLGYKGVDILKYKENTAENFEIGYNWLKESIKLRKAKSGPSELLTFMTASNALYKADVHGAGQVVEDYGMVSEVYDAATEKQLKKIQPARASIDKIFEEVASCDDLIPFYTNKFAENSENLDFLKKSTEVLKGSKCTDSDIYFQLADKLNSLEPSAGLAYELAKLSNKNENLEDAARYYKQAIELEVEDVQKAKYYLELGDVTRRLGNYSQAKTYALNSAELDGTSGYPYLLIGNIYAAASKSCGEEDFQQKAVYWAAVDKFIKAKTVDPELTDDANKFIEAYRPHFPDNETIFFQGYKEGDKFTVGCWINEITTVRAR